MSHALLHLQEVARLALKIPHQDIEKLADELIQLRQRQGWLYIVGLGGSAGNASHMAADFRKLCRLQAYSMDNIPEITARANDEGWPTIFDGFLNSISGKDALFVLSVGGGTPQVSLPLVKAIDKAKSVNAMILGIVGPNGGYTYEHGDCVIRVPCEIEQTPHTEAFQAVIWHLLCCHPLLQRQATKWV